MTTKRSKASSDFDLETRILGGPLTFGEAVDALRLRHKISPGALAAKIGISRQYLCDIEKGRRLVSPQQAARIAKAFRHPPHVFVQLALQDSVRESGLKLKVIVQAA
jgi:transcriptional regulator with XRE-family HTH domain